LRDSIKYRAITPLLAAQKRETHQPLWRTLLSSKSLDFKPSFNTFACEYQNSYGSNFELTPMPLLNIV